MPITAITSYKEIDLSIDDPSKVIVMSDVDLTTIDVRARRIMSDTNQKARFEFIKRLTGQTTPMGDAVAIAYSDAANRYSLVEPGFDDFIRKLQAQGYYVMAVTSRRTGLPTKTSTEKAEENLLRKLAELNVDFSASSPSRDQGIISLANRMAKSGPELQNMHDFDSITGPICKNGVLLTASHPKGDALDTYFANIGYKPQIIVAIDDTLSKLESMQAYCDANGIIFIGYHYQAAELVAKELPLDKEVVKLQLITLLKTGLFISDDEAKLQLSRTIDETQQMQDNMLLTMNILATAEKLFDEKEAQQPEMLQRLCSHPELDLLNKVMNKFHQILGFEARYAATMYSTNWAPVQLPHPMLSDILNHPHLASLLEVLEKLAAFSIFNPPAPADFNTIEENPQMCIAVLKFNGEELDSLMTQLNSITDPTSHFFRPAIDWMKRHLITTGEVYSPSWPTRH